MDVETAQREFDRIGKKDLPSLEEVAERGRLRKIIKFFRLTQCLIPCFA
jgi:hypothetical protein